MPRFGSHTHNLREVIEVLVPGVQSKIVLQDQSREPHVVCGNWCALLSELAEHGRIVMSGLVVREEGADAILEQEPPQNPFILRLPSTVHKASPKLTNDDEGQENRLGFFQEGHGFRRPFAEIDVSIGIEGYSHRQRSSSTRS